MLFQPWILLSYLVSTASVPFKVQYYASLSQKPELKKPISKKDLTKEEIKKIHVNDFFLFIWMHFIIALKDFIFDIVGSITTIKWADKLNNTPTRILIIRLLNWRQLL